MSIPNTQTVTKMEIPSHSKSIIDGKFQRMKSFRENRLDNDIMTFLKRACASLNAKGASNYQGPYKRPLLHYAAMGDCTELLRFLLQNGAEVDCHDQNKRTPLSWAAEYGALGTVKILLANGAKLNTTDDMFSTPLTWLLQAGTGQRADTEAYLRMKGAKEKGATRRWFWGKIERKKV